MAATKLVLILPLFILPLLICEDSNSSLKSVIYSLEKLIAFYKENYRDLNLDGLFGLRTLEGHLQLLLSEHQNGSHSHLSGEVLSSLRSMVTDSTMISNQALEFVKKDDEGYFNSMSYVIGQPWNILHKHRKLDQELRWKPAIYKSTKQYKIDEQTSDKCMSELTGSNRSDKKGCMISKECLDTMTMKGLTEYGITHQILWTMLAEKTNCLHEVNSLLGSSKGTSVSAMQQEFCTNNFFEMAAVVHVYMQGKIKHEYQDLFLEQQFVCPSLGFYEFLKKEYLDQILSWQFPSGCFGDPKNNVNTINVRQEKTAMKVDGPLDMQQQNMNLGLSNQKKQGVFDALRNINRLPPNSSYNIQSNDNNSPIIAPNYSQIVNKFVNNPINFKQNKNRPEVYNNAAFVPTQQIQTNGVDSNRNHDNTNNNNNLNIVPVQQAPKQNNYVVPGNKNLDDSKLFLGMQPGINVRANVIKSNNNMQPYVKSLRKLRSVNENNVYIGRKLLAEKEMKDGCMSHTTAVATGALVMYLRYLIDPGPLDFYGNHHILQETSRSLLGQGLDGVPARGGDSRKVKNEELIIVKDPNINLNPDPEEINANEVVEDDDQDEEEDYDEDENSEEDDDPEYDNDEKHDEEYYPDAEKSDAKKHPVVHFDPRPNLAKDIEIKKNEYEGGDFDYQVNGKNNNPNDADYQDYEDSELKNIPKKQIGLNAEDSNKVSVDKNYNNNNVNNIDDNNNVNNIDNNNNNNNNNINVESDKDAHVNMANVDSVPVKELPPPSMRTLFVFFTVCSMIILIFLFRFIKKRRIHIRYHPRDFLRL